MSSRGGVRGDLAIVLHSHMPYVEGFGSWPFGEEWLLEAIASCYLPVIELLEDWANSDSEAVATVGVTPVLADQFEVEALGAHFVSFMRGTRADCHRQDIAGLESDGQHGAADALRASARDYERAADEFERRGGDLVGALARLRDNGTIELWTSAATHAILPLTETEAGARLQVRTGVSSHRKRFGTWSGGLWLPECAYRPPLEQLLAQEGVSAFCVDQTDHLAGLDVLEPIATGSGAIAVPIDWTTVKLVWDGRGYPADPAYRDYHAPTINGMRPWNNGGQPYDREAGHVRAREHAREFVTDVGKRLDRFRDDRDRHGLCVCALDTELLGHWWYEGPAWLEAVAMEAAAAGIRMVKLPEALEDHRPVSRRLAESSWGARKDLSTWDSPKVADFRWAAAGAELELMNAAIATAPHDGRQQRALARAARELLALQSSDWAFMDQRELAADYPRRRVAAHAEAFRRAISGLGGSLQDFPAMPAGSNSTEGRSPEVDSGLRGLAPSLELSAFLEPSSRLGLDRP